MTLEDWICPTCGCTMIRPLGSNYMTCSYGYGKLHKCWGIMDLPIATRINTKTYLLAPYLKTHPYEFEYVPHTHKHCLDTAPPEGCVVARVRFRAGWAARMLRPKKTSLAS